MLITEEIKSKYDAIGYKKDGKVELVHESGNTGMRRSYPNVEEFMEEAQNKSIRGIVFESVNG